MNRHGMEDFQPYESKPLTRYAYQLKDTDIFAKVDEATYRIMLPEGFLLDFRAYEEPQVGDYIVYLTADDVYHCSAEVFRARNVVED